MFELTLDFETTTWMKQLRLRNNLNNYNTNLQIKFSWNKPFFIYIIKHDKTSDSMTFLKIIRLQETRILKKYLIACTKSNTFPI